MLERIMNLQILLCIMAAAGAFGAVGMLAVHLTYRRTLRRTNAVTSLKEKWLNLWKTRDKLLNRMNFLVWLPSLLSTLCLGLAILFVTKLKWTSGLPLRYLYLGTVIPVALMILRQALDFAYREELVMNSLADYILSARTKKRGDSHTAKGGTSRIAAQDGPRSPGRDGGEDHGKHPPDSGDRKPFQQNAEPGGRGDHA